MADRQEQSPNNVNVQVAVRCRPLNTREKASGNLHVVNTEPSHNRIRVAHKKLDRTYQYDHVFGPFASQEEVFSSTVEPIVREMLQGFSTTVFAYGQTGTGKTHTMEGDISSADDMGVIPRSVHAIFDYLDGISADYTVRTSFLELYNEELQDLLADGNPKSKVVLREDTKRGVVCCGLEEVQVLTSKDIFNILGRGIQQRKTAETLMNKNSSRSHSIFTLKIMIKECMPDGQEVMRNGQLNLVDLAGSECVGRSGAKNARAREAGSINQSLLTLGRVITALVEHHPHVPYRDSKLTRLLQESLGGRTKTCIIATVTSSSDALEETLSSLDYALKAKNIQNKPVANQKLSKTHLLKEYAGEVESLRSMLQASRDKNGVYMEPWRFDQMENTLASQSNQIKEMEDILSSRSSETKDLKAEREELRTKGEELEEELEASKGREEATTARLDETCGRLERCEEDLEASRTESANLQERLTATKHTLKITEEDLAATRVVVQEQMCTEGALRSEAEQTKASLASAGSDVEGLWAKVARQAEEAAGKQVSAVTFGETATAAASEVSDAVNRFTGEHEKGCEGLREGLSKAEALTKAATRGLSTAAAEALEEVGRRCNEMAQGVAEGGTSTDGLVKTAASVLEDALVAQKEAVVKWNKEVEDSLSVLRQGLEGHEVELSKLSGDVRQRAREAETEMTDLTNKCAGELEAVRSWYDERIAAQTEQMELQSREALSVAAKSKEDTKVEVAQLMQSLSTLMSGLQANVADRADRQAHCAGEAWTDSISSARSLGVEVSKKMDGVAASVATESESVVQKLVLSSRATENTIQVHQKAAEAFAVSTVGVSDSVAAGAARSSSLADDASSSLKENLSAVSESVSATADACATAVETLSDANRNAVERIAALATSAETDAAGRALETEAQVSGLTSAVEELGSNHASSLGRCVTHIEGHVKEACVTHGPSGGTPERKRYPRPDRFSATRPHDVIVKEFHAGERLSPPPPLSLVAENGGDAARSDDGAGGSSGDAMFSGLGRGDCPEQDEEMELAAAARDDTDSSLRGDENASAASSPRGAEGSSDKGGEGKPMSTDGVAEGGGSEEGMGDAEYPPPLGEATNKRKQRSKIPTTRRTTRRARAV